MHRPINEIEPILAEARAKFGNKNQIVVTIEELNELMTLLTKPLGNYPEESRNMHFKRALLTDEVADSYIVLQHVVKIFGIDDAYVCYNSSSKAIEGWALSELCSKLSKFVRYDDEEDAIKRMKPEIERMVMDCYLVVNTTAKSYKLNPELIRERILHKGNRVKRWLCSDRSFEVSLEDREVK